MKELKRGMKRLQHRGKDGYGMVGLELKKNL